MTDYSKQAIDFLEKYSILFKVESLGVGKHFLDDKEPRARYLLTLFRTTKSSSVEFEFGQSIDATYKKQTPKAYDLLASLTKYDPDTFENFCGDFGYDTDSRKGLETYLAVQAEWQKVRKFFTVEELEELREIQ